MYWMFKTKLRGVIHNTCPHITYIYQDNVVRDRVVGCSVGRVAEAGF